MPSQGGALQAIGLNLPQIFINRTIRLQGKLLQSVGSISCRIIALTVGACPAGDRLKSSTDLHQSDHSLASKLLPHLSTISAQSQIFAMLLVHSKTDASGL